MSQLPIQGQDRVGNPRQELPAVRNALRMRHPGSASELVMGVSAGLHTSTKTNQLMAASR